MYSLLIKYLVHKISIFHMNRILQYFHKKELKIIFDIGSYKGDFIDCFKKKHKKAFFYSFEPHQDNFLYQKKKYKYIKNIKLFNYGLSDNKTKLNLKVNYLSNASTFSEFNKTAYYFKIRKLILGKSKVTISNQICNLNTLDNFVENNNTRVIDLLKLDVEGFELKVLKGAKKTLTMTKYIIIEITHSNIFQNYKKKEIHNFLTNNGFEKEKSFLFPIFNFEDRIYKKKFNFK